MRRWIARDQIIRARQAIEQGQLCSTVVARWFGIPGLARPKDRVACKRGHPFTPATTYLTSAGSRQCRVCVNAWHRAKRRRGRQGLVPLGLSPRSYGMKIAWAHRKRDYGPSGFTPERLPSLRAERRAILMRKPHRHRGKTHCCHGHKFTVANTGRNKRGYRYCKACNIVASGRAHWRQLQARAQRRQLARARDRLFAMHAVMLRTGNEYSYRRALRAYQQLKREAG